ncbi:Superfamilies 1 and 2 helicase C-terminal domain profile [Propionibacterium ruminifibrarum]|uniref:Superfamilies 1 and 2 helicase C-terminal domain profile n=1 Tax=Propionibacterium ruminifibrarum TaxID=1962131 RepID=A0A375I519_9ACTN|nr:helicase-related protein [Propionibacterium ruminifibrarum]SPF68482.1 Superfamilies 1 and 2 helicase C-terminal domain profile [Propionibacterium ruminifibrarum]
MTDTILSLGALHAGQRLRGLVPGQVVTVVAVDPIDDGLVEVFYRDESGQSGAHMVTGADAAALTEVSAEDSTPAFDADPDEFRLAAEAQRIKYAALYDPMAAVNSSDVDPLPHQIRAVYEELLPRVPLRFLLADDPGAGKTIMAGLYIKELILRSDCERAIVVAPGGLVEQWREELATKFDLRFEVFNHHMVDDAQGRNVFAEHDLLIVRMDQISRSPELMEQLSDVAWDVAVVDEAHRMSAHYSSWAGEVDETKRFKLGRLLSETANNYLLMTATPHAGKEEDFQLFMSLLDRDRFEGKFREGIHRTDTQGLMRRMVKEDLLTFDGKPLFPERRAYTVAFELSPAERDLYEQVTDYVRTEMGRAERIAQAGDRKRGNNVGFALTVLQRRLASSPEAILRSLERRQARLEARLRETRRAVDDVLDASLPALSVEDFDDVDEETTWEERAEFEAGMNEVVDRATAAQTIDELRAEITILEDLIRVARRVRLQDVDKKWAQLRAILDEQLLSHDTTGAARKIIIFTEHRDTLDYLHGRITAQLGRADAVITIHGGTSREDRKAAQEQFTHSPETVVLLATDAAGEGLNLQRAHLMVNYDLPWNPNRIEQRFGRIHRIGQREVCHLWNLVASDTREGDVFNRLLSKIDQMGKAYDGNLFNVLGERDAFQERSLRDLLIEAIRYGDQPEVKARLGKIIDAGVSAGLGEMIRERALHPQMFSALDLDAVRARMELARERRLQPGYIAAFFLSAFERLGGRIRRRESGRYQITRVPERLVGIARRANRWAPVADSYERVTFELERVRVDGRPTASLIAPGHPLLGAVIEATIADLGEALSAGTVLVDRRSTQAETPMLMYTVEQRIHNATSKADTVSHHFDYPLLARDGTVTVSPAPPYLDYESPRAGEREAIAAVIRGEWVRQSHDKAVRAHAYREGLLPRMEEVRARLEAEAARTRVQVKDRLLAEVNHWDAEYNRLDALERSGVIGRLRAETALARARQLDDRLDRRLHELDQVTNLVAVPSVIRGTALIVPSRMLAPSPGVFAHETEQVERRAVEAVLAAERALGRTPVEMPRNNPGYDIRSIDQAGRTHYIEVKGRIHGAETFTITTNEVTFAQTQGDRHRLALVEVSPDGPGHDRLRYVTQAFSHIEPSATTRSYNEEWRGYWTRGGPPR